MYLFRIHIRPSGGTADFRTTFEYCLGNGLLGVGWRTESGRNTKYWDEYFKEASAIHDNLNTPKYIYDWVTEGDLVWTRDQDGHYYLARVKSGWEYWQSKQAIELDIDVGNVFRCDIRQVEVDAVPGKVVACFRATRSIQKIADERAREYSKYLWNQLDSSHVYDVDTTKFSDVFMMLDDEETEDVVFLYLQSLGWYVVPNSRKADTMSFEFFLVHPKTGERAVTQVKTGAAILNTDDYRDERTQVFLFQTNDLYEGSRYDNIVRISRTAVLRFLDQSANWLPQSIQNKLNVVRQKGEPPA